MSLQWHRLLGRLLLLTCLHAGRVQYAMAVGVLSPVYSVYWPLHSRNHIAKLMSTPCRLRKAGVKQPWEATH